MPVIIAVASAYPDVSVLGVFWPTIASSMVASIAGVGAMIGASLVVAGVFEVSTVGVSTVVGVSIVAGASTDPVSSVEPSTGTTLVSSYYPASANNSARGF